MSQQNVELARSVFARWNAGERRFRDEEIHPEVVVVSRGVLGKTVRGRAGVRHYLREIDEQFDEWEMAMEDWRDAGDCVAALGHVRLHAGGAASRSINQLGSWLRSEAASCFASRPFLTTP